MPYTVKYDDTTKMFGIVNNDPADNTHPAILDKYESHRQAQERIDRILAAAKKVKAKEAALPVVTLAGAKHTARNVHLGHGKITLSPPASASFRGGYDLGSFLFPDIPGVVALINEVNTLRSSLKEREQTLRSYGMIAEVPGRNPDEIATSWDYWVTRMTALIGGTDPANAPKHPGF